MEKLRYKRRWSWSKENLRKSRTFSRKLWPGGSPPKWLCDRNSNQYENTPHKKALHKFLRGGEYLHCPIRTYKSTAKWYWW